MVRYASILAALATGLALSDVASAWPKWTHDVRDGSPRKFCIPFLTCKPAWLLRRQGGRGPQPPWVNLTRIDLWELGYIVNSSMTPPNEDGVMVSTGLRLPQGLRVAQPHARLQRRDPNASTSEVVQQQAPYFQHGHPNAEERGMMPYTAVGKVLVQVFNDYISDCTGTLINDTLLLTADHCLPWNRAPPNNRGITVEFYPGYHGSKLPNAATDFMAYAVECVGINPPVNEGHSAGVRRLHRAPRHRQRGQWR